MWGHKHVLGWLGGVVFPPVNGRTISFAVKENQSIKRVSFADRRQTNGCNSSPLFSALYLSCLSKQTAGWLPDFPLLHPLCGAVKISLVFLSAENTLWKLKWMWVENVFRDREKEKTCPDSWPTLANYPAGFAWVCARVCVCVCVFVSLLFLGVFNKREKCTSTVITGLLWPVQHQRQEVSLRSSMWGHTRGADNLPDEEYIVKHLNKYLAI